MLSSRSRTRPSLNTSILYTREYAEFYERVAGRFIHYVLQDAPGRGPQLHQLPAPSDDRTGPERDRGPRATGAPTTRSVGLRDIGLHVGRGIYEFGGIVEQESERHYSDPADLRKLEDFIEPVVLRHPTTGEESIIIAERYVRFAESENTITPGRPLLDTVVQIIDAGLVYRHRWKVGDILIWDNCATLHKGDAVGKGSMKVTHRVVVT